MGFFTPDAVFDTSPLGLGVFEGREAIRRLFEDWEAAYEDYEFEFEEGRDLGNGVTFAVVVRRARPRGGTGWVPFRSGIVSIWFDGLVERATNYADIDEARIAAERLAQERGVGVSEANIEVVRRAYAALNERDFDSLLKLSDPDFVFDLSRSIGPQKGVYRGPHEVR